LDPLGFLDAHQAHLVANALDERYQFQKLSAGLKDQPLQGVEAILQVFGFTPEIVRQFSTGTIAIAEAEAIVRQEHLKARHSRFLHRQGAMSPQAGEPVLVYRQPIVLADAARHARPGVNVQEKRVKRDIMFVATDTET